MDLPNLIRLRDAFHQELLHASNHEQTSLPYIRHQLPSHPLVRDDELFQVLVIGGSVFRKALVKSKGKNIEIITLAEHTQPSFRTKAQFYEYLMIHLDDKVGNLAINFAYPLSPVFSHDKLDGILITGSKENTFDGLVGTQLALGIEQYILQTHHRHITVSLANDVICLLLSGKDRAADNALVGAIMGTGTNITFFAGDAAINLESANFDKFHMSEIGKRIDGQSSHPGKALFEKETAGAYLYKHFNALLEKEKLPYPKISSTKELKMLALERHIPRISLLAQKLIERSAGMFAAQLAGVAAFKQTDITVVMEGSFFWKNQIYRDAVNASIQDLSSNYHITIERVEQSPILGGAKLLT